MSRLRPLPLLSLTGDKLPTAPSAGPIAPLVAPPPAAEVVEEKGAATLRQQRDEARQQREVARQQRDESRRQRDELRARLAVVEAQLTALATAGEVANIQVPRDLSEIDAFQVEGERARRLPEIRKKRESGASLAIREAELLGARLMPPMARALPRGAAPGPNIAFLTVANAAFLRGLEGLVLSLLHVYPDLRSPIHICHDGTLNAFVQARLRSYYDNLVFIEPDMGWFDQVPSASDNHKRIGKLGYMNIEGLALTGFDRVVLLDSDILVTDDISALWQGETYNVCYDCGDREYVSRSDFTQDWVFNSGVISIPGHMTGPAAYAEFRDLVQAYAATPVCPVIDRFADQKIWNIFLRDKPKTYFPLNYNCNIKYLAKFLNGHMEGISIIHFAGPKPWNSKMFVAQEHLQPAKSKALQYPKPWLDSFRTLMFRARGEAYRAHAAQHRRREPVRADSDAAGKRTCVMIGNGPSMAHTDMRPAESLEKFAFNWFILADSYDELRPEHLVLGSHMLFGGWATTEPRFPEGYLEKLRAHRHRPALWTSFYFREYLEAIGLHREFEINYGLFEKPFKRFIDRVGRYNADIDTFLDDGRTGVLSLGVPAAISMGFERILLVGCDSNYNQPGTASKYFYDMSQHTSAETREDSLTSTWTEEGRGQFVYKLVSEELARRGIDFIDCTVGGALQTVRKGVLQDVLRDLE
jgi:lipopolysaccharide biosynthesis glycosyltransferase